MTGAGSDEGGADEATGSADGDDPDGTAGSAGGEAPDDPSRTGSDGSPGTVPAAIHDRVRERAEAIAKRERDVAVRKLEAEGELTDGQREAVAEMTRGIVDGLLEAPEATLREADDRDQLRAALQLFGSDGDRTDRDRRGDAGRPD